MFALRWQSTAFWLVVVFGMLAMVGFAYLRLENPIGRRNLTRLVQDRSPVGVRFVRLLPNGPRLEGQNAAEILGSCRVSPDQEAAYRSIKSKYRRIPRFIEIGFADGAQVECEIDAYQGGGFFDLCLNPLGEDDVWTGNFFSKAGATSSEVIQFFDSLESSKHKGG
jgi:hypothetical protein